MQLPLEIYDVWGPSMWVVLLELFESLLVQQRAKEFSQSRCGVAMATGEPRIASLNDLVRVEHRASTVISSLQGDVRSGQALVIAPRLYSNTSSPWNNTLTLQR